MPYYEYGKPQTDYLRRKDKALAAAMDAIGHIRREVEPDLFTALVTSIMSQQISSKAAVTVCNRLAEAVDGKVTPESIVGLGAEGIQRCGTSHRKAAYIWECAKSVRDGALDLDSLRDMSDADVCRRLAAIRGIGVWTAEMLMTFSMQRPDIMSWDDLAIHRGLRMLYRHKRVTRDLFEKYRRRYSPHASVACLYLWAIAGGACPGLSDPAAKPAVKPADKRGGAGQNT